MVQCTLSWNRILGPYFVENEKVTGHNYKKNPSIKSVSRTSKQTGRQCISTGWCFFSTGRCCTGVLATKSFHTVGYESLPDSQASRIARLDCVWLCLIWISERVLFREPFTTMQQKKNKFRHGIQSLTENTLENINENTENHLWFLLTEWSGHLEHVLHWKESTSNINDIHCWVAEMNKI